MSENEEKLYGLPPGWEIVPEPLVGVSCLDNEKKIVSQHPFDCNAFRVLCWEHYYNRIAQLVAEIRRPNPKGITEMDRRIVDVVLEVLKGERRL